MAYKRRSLSLTSEILFSESEVVFELPQSLVAAMALEFALLLTGLAEALRILDSPGRSIVLTHVERDRVAHAAVRRDQRGGFVFALGTNQLQYLYVTLLQVHRDQIAEVSHVHIDGNTEEGPYDLTIMFEVFREPISADEAGKLMSDS